MKYQRKTHSHHAAKGTPKGPATATTFSIQKKDTVGRVHSNNNHSNGRYINEMPDTEVLIDEWITRPEIGLAFDPFRQRDAGMDFRLPLYLVDQGEFGALWGDWQTLLFAPAGGGKTAYRVRLAHACRGGMDNRKVFPITVPALRPGQSDAELTRTLLQAATSELLLQFLIYPERFTYIEQNSELRKRILTWLKVYLQPNLTYLLPQIKILIQSKEKSWDEVWRKIVEQFDPAAQGLPLYTSREDVGYLVKKLLRWEDKDELDRSPGNNEPIRMFADLLNKLGYESIYILIDGVDAYPEYQRNKKNCGFKSRMVRR